MLLYTLHEERSTYYNLCMKLYVNDEKINVTNIYVFGGSSRLESLLIASDCLFLNRPKNLGQNHRQSICFERFQNQSHFKYSN